MRHFIFGSVVAGALAVATPGAAQDQNDLTEGLGLLGEGAQLILDGLLEDIRPALEEMWPYFEEEVLPFLSRMSALMDNVTSYELPERLPNGDIIIRRSPDAPPFEPDPGGNGDVEL